MRIFSGVQPTGRKHLGNYLGAFLPQVASQERGESIYCIVDLHATTVAYEPARLRSDVYDLQAVWMAAGLDPQRCVLFRQSDVLEHAELQWLLNSVTGYGELSRDVAQRFNSRFGETFVVPKGVYREVGARIMDLQTPEKKMSTTGGTPAGTIYVTDEPAAIIKKFKSAVTDSGREIRHSADKAGISNLLEILAVVRGSSIAQLEQEFDGAGYGDFKLAVGEAVASYLAPVRERFEALRADEHGLEQNLRLGAEKARAIATETMRDVRRAMGVGPVG